MDRQRTHILDYQVIKRSDRTHYVVAMAAGLVSYAFVAAGVWAVQLYAVMPIIKNGEAVAWALVMSYAALLALAQWRLRWRGFAAGALLGLGITGLGAGAYYLWWTSKMSFEG